MSIYKVRGPRIKRLAMISPSDTTLTPEELAFAKQHFDKLDTDGTGVIDTEELPSLLRHIGFYMEKERLDRYYIMFFGHNLNTMDPVLSWDRFVLLFSMIMRNQLPVTLTQIFRLRLLSQSQEADYIKFAERGLEDAINLFTEFDCDDSGELDPKELKTLLSCLGTKELDFDEFLKVQMSKMDKNNDQKVGFDEFVECYNELMDLV
jgi:Ca2+-binding EF-hand superfamily protein